VPGQKVCELLKSQSKFMFLPLAIERNLKSSFSLSPYAMELLISFDNFWAECIRVAPMLSYRQERGFLERVWQCQVCLEMDSQKRRGWSIRQLSASRWSTLRQPLSSVRASQSRALSLPQNHLGCVNANEM
jgi:hypothetical protein